MQLFDRKNQVFLLVSLGLVAIGFLAMKMENGEYGLGPLALTMAPILILCGYIMGIKSIFYNSIQPKKMKKQLPFLISGWAVFFGSLVVYVLTLEETASLWDCSEFIACAYKLQVPHAPGAPLFLMIGRVFSLFSFGDRMEVAFWINMTSALSSAFAVMFTFWSVVMLGKRINSKATDFTLILAGLVGAFSFAFADSFWYSAVEAETYAMATLFLAICFWAILKWDREIEQRKRNKWLIFILYILGLSIGVHPMSLLVLPALSLIIAFKNHAFSGKTLFVATFLGAAAILFLNHVVLFGLPDAMKYFDIFFVNMLGFPFYSGAIAFCALFLVAGYFGNQWSLKRRKKAISLSIVGLMYFLIGYSSYFMIIIRSQANTSIDENNPDNLISLAAYLKRESYGANPLMYGPNYESKVKSYKKGSPVYVMSNDRYEIADHKTEYEYANSDKSFLPRIYSDQPNHKKTYKEWTGLKDGQKPRFIDNLNFMLQYQVGHMYLRYLMFNFSGRASDVQHAEWLSPLEIFQEVPPSMAENKARNNFLMLPFLMGLIGIIYQYKRDKKGFWAVLSFFLFLGIILVIYLNSTPNEPRERDYIYVGSYLAFAIWIGVGTMGIATLWSRIRNGRFKVFGVLLVLIPLLMLIEGFDDHDRSGRTVQVDHARNTLASCAPNAILFTGGDNDTFPLWYVQEVEGFRTDVRVIVLSYFNAEWYIDQMQRQVYESEPLPFSLENNHYRQGGLNDALPFVENPSINGAINLDRFMELIRSEHKALQVSMSGGTKYNSIPSRTFYLDIDKSSPAINNMVPEFYQNSIPSKLELTWTGNFMDKSTFMVLDLINNNKWERPLYFNLTSLNSISLEVRSHVLQEGLVYRLLPLQLQEHGAIHLDAMYSNLMDKSEYRDLKDENVYYNHEDFQLRILQTTKRNYNVLARTLLANNEHEKAREVVNVACSNFYGENIKLDFTTIETIDLLFNLDEKERANNLAERYYKNSKKLLSYYQDSEKLGTNESQLQLYTLNRLREVCRINGNSTLAAKCSVILSDYLSSM